MAAVICPSESVDSFYLILTDHTMVELARDYLFCSMKERFIALDMSYKEKCFILFILF